MARAWISTKPQRFAGGEDAALRGDIQHHGIQQGFHPEGQRFIDKALGVSRAGQVLLEDFQAKTVVDALLQNAAQFLVALDDQHIFGAILFGGDGAASPPGPRR